MVWPSGGRSTESRDQFDGPYIHKWLALSLLSNDLAIGFVVKHND
jgi:hypothetical protein